MSTFQSGTVCVVIEGQGHGLVDKVVKHLGAAFGGDDTYLMAATMLDGTPTEAIIDRWKLRPVVGSVGLSTRAIPRPDQAATVAGSKY